MNGPRLTGVVGASRCWNLTATPAPLPYCRALWCRCIRFPLRTTSSIDTCSPRFLAVHGSATIVNSQLTVCRQVPCTLPQLRRQATGSHGTYDTGG
jgi:hypothetical protein